MTIDQAECLFNEYEALLQDADKRGARRSPSLLPASKTAILQAIRMLIARLHFQALDTQDALGRFIQATMFLDGFSHEPLDAIQFVAAMQERRRDIVNFYRELINIPRNDRFYWQRVYALVGITTETKRTTFFEHIKERLGRAVHLDRSATNRS